MRIALVSNEVAGFHNGGIGTYVVEAGHALTAAGHEVWLITQPPSPAASEAMRRLPGFARVEFVEAASTAAALPPFLRARHALRFAQLAHDTLRACGVAFDYIEFADYGAAGAVAVPEQRWFGSHGDAVVAVVLHSPTLECWEYNRTLHLLGPVHREIAALEHDTIRAAPLVWSPSTRLREMVCGRLGLAADAVALVRYPMRLAAAAPPPPAPRERLEQLKFLYFGRIEPRKGVRELVAAFAEMPELSIECIGRDGPTAPLQTSEIEYLRRRGAHNVQFVANLPREELLRRLATADVVVLPSPWDNWPNACIEAMAAARVVIGGKNGGMGEMIEHGRSGFHVDGADPADLVRVVRQDLRAALPRLSAIGNAAATRIRELSEPSRYVAAITELVARHRGKGRLPATPAARSRVSVIVPWYQEDRALLHDAVGSAIAQTHRDLEILVVDDGSPRADAEAVLAATAQLDPRVRVLRKANGGLASARNHAIEQAAGDFFLFLDADNVLRPDYAAIGLEVFTRDAATMAVIPRFRAFDEHTRAPRFVMTPLPYDRTLAIFRNSLGDAGAMFRRDVFHGHGLRFDGDVDCYSDWALWLDLARLGLRTQVIPRELYDYRMRADSMMAQTAWDKHLAMVGLLIERHLPPGDAAAERAMLTALTQGWGVGALLPTFGAGPEAWEQPVATAKRLASQGRTRDRVAQALGTLADRWPRIGAVGRKVLGGLLHLHGRHKDRRRGGASS